MFCLLSKKQTYFRFADNQMAEMLHIILGIVLVFSCNFMVIIGIIADICFLLIPWLVIYALGKNDADFFSFSSLTFFHCSMFLPYLHYF